MPSLFYPLVITFLLFGYFKDFVFSANFTNLIVMWYSYLCVCMCVCVCVCVCVCMCVCGVYTVCGMVSFLHLWVSSNMEKILAMSSWLITVEAEVHDSSLL